MNNKIYIQKVIYNLLLFVALNGSAQNLVLNPSFESVHSSSLQCDYYQYPSQFAAAINNWSYPTGGTTDIFSTNLPTFCTSNPLVTNVNYIGLQNPRSGNLMLGFAPWAHLYSPLNPNLPPIGYREYIQGTLSAPLIAGTSYKIEYYVVLAENSPAANNNFGVKFSTSPVIDTTNYTELSFPDVNYPGTPILDTSSWTKMEYCFTPATSGLQYFIIGNFFNNASTSVTFRTPNQPNMAFGTFSYYYIDDVSITPILSPSLSATFNCTTNTASITAMPSASSYTWAAPSGVTFVSTTNSQALPAMGAGIYTVTLKDSINGCLSVGSNTVLVEPLSGSINYSNTSICQGQSTLLNASAIGGKPPYTYQWSPTAVNSYSVIVSPTVSAVYSLTVTDDVGCITQINSNIITVYPLPQAAFNFSPNVPSLQIPTVHFTNQSSGANSYAWFFNDASNSTSTLVNPFNVYSLAGVYVVTLTVTDTTNSCTSSTTRTITVLENSELIVPNVFTPNGDGANDAFKISANEIDELTCEIFNRWGTKIYTLKSANDSWDGSGCSSGTYFYILKFTNYNGKEESKQGYINLFR